MTKPVHLATASAVSLVVAALMLGGPIAGLLVGSFAGLVGSGIWALVKYG